MAVSVTLGTPLADALSNVVRPKLVEVGWSSDAQDDSALAEYIILMLVNGKTQDQITSELSNDLLNLGPDDTEAVDFSKWLFEQVDILNRQLNGGGEPSTAATDNQEESTTQAIPSFSEGPEEGSGAQDADMGDAGQDGNEGGVPTGPKAMRNGKQGGRGRLMGQLSKAMDRSNDSMLHRVRSQPGAGRINTHAGGVSKGPRNFQGGNGRMPPGRPPMGGPMGMPPGMGMPGQMPRGGGPGGNMMPMNPQQQMQMMALLEEQARMMAQFVPGMVPPAINPAFQNGGNPQAQQGRSLFERVERQQPRPQNGNFAGRANSNGISVQKPNEQDTDMSTEMDIKPDSSGMEVDGSSTEPGPDTVCRFNLKCTRKDCQFAHQSPAAPEGVPVDVTDHCPFGAACKNRKCLGRHPSPAQKSVHQSEELCRFYPNCTNPNCSFKHPSMPMCRNGADCTVSGCKFTHLQIPCKFTPCLNRSCQYKHAEGQRGAFTDKVWTADSADGKESTHVSERKFTTDDDGEEELIKPADPSSHNQQPLST